MTGDGGGELERNIGFLEAMTLGGGTMIGAGIFILPGIAAEGAGPASAVSFLIAGGVALLAALSLSELATGMPVAGGSYHYVNRALGGLFGSVVGWGMWTGLMFASAFYMIGFGQYLVAPIPFLDGRVFVVLLGLVGLTLIVGINYYGTEESSKLQNVMIGAETLVVLAYVAVGLFFIDPANLEPFAPFGAGGVVATTGVVFVSFLGFEIIATVAGEVKNPSRNIPLTMLLSVVLVTVLYALVMLVTTGVVPFTELRDSLVPVSDVAVVFVGSAGVVAIVAAAAIAAISSSNSSILAAARVNFAMGRDALMSDRLNVTHDRFGTPHRAIVATGVVTAVLIGAGLQIQAIVALLAEVASFSFLVSYSLVHVALVVFRRADPDEYDPSFRIPDLLYPAVPVLGILLTAVVISQMAPVIILLGLGLVALGAGWYVVYARDHAIDTGLFGDAFPRPLFGDGTATPSAVYRVVVAVANPDTQRDLIRLAAASAHAHADEAAPELVAVNVLQVPADSSRQNVAAEQLDHQHDLLAAAREVAESMDVSLRTRAVTGVRVDETLVEVFEEEAPDQALVGWQGTPPGDGSLFGPNLDAVVAEAPCELSVVTFHDDVVGRPVALAGPGPHSPVAARRAVDFAAVEGTTPTLLSVQRPGDDESAAVARGEAMVADVADRAGLDPAAYDVEVVVDEDVKTAILDTVNHYETVCVGLSEQSETSRLMFGTIAERISREATSNVGIVRGSYDEPVTAERTVGRSAVDEPS
jgi:amino acid transporter/nucleotide-binding universal stress UspA family protein